MGEPLNLVDENKIHVKRGSPAFLTLLDLLLPKVITAF